jgi:hypothetical protein
MSEPEKPADDRQRVLEIVQGYNEWVSSRSYPNCRPYPLAKIIRNSTSQLTTFLSSIAESGITSDEFTNVLSATDRSSFLQSVAKIDFLFWLFKQRGGAYNYQGVLEGKYVDFR